MQILVVEDDAMLGQALELGLSDRGFVIQWVRSGAAAISELNRTNYDALVLDLGLPDLDGSRVLTSCRKRGMAIPVLILTARDQSAEIVAQLDNGADDYMTKPFDMNELAARLRALVRRQRGFSSADIQVGPITLNSNCREVTVEGEPVNLSRREFELLQALMNGPSQVHSRDKLEAIVFNNDATVESNAIEVHVHNLRKKLGNKQWIETIRGIGYRLKCD